MTRYAKDDLERFMEYSVFPPKRIVYIGSVDYINDDESGTDFLMAEKAIKGLSYLDSISDKPITILMNNIGGEWAHGIAIYDCINACRCHVTIISLGYCCSMGSIVLQAADWRVLSKNTIFLIHDGDSIISGHSKNVSAWAEHEKLTRQKMYEIYKNKMKEKNSKITIKQIEKLCTIDKIYTPEEAVIAGLADEVLGDINYYLKEQ